MEEKADGVGEGKVRMKMPCIVIFFLACFRVENKVYLRPMLWHEETGVEMGTSIEAFHVFG